MLRFARVAAVTMLAAPSLAACASEQTPVAQTVRTTSYVSAPLPPPPACHSSYPGVCIPPAPPDLDCDDIDESEFSVRGFDPHGFDADGDGVGCEEYNPGGYGYTPDYGGLDEYGGRDDYQFDPYAPDGPDRYDSYDYDPGYDDYERCTDFWTC